MCLKSICDKELTDVADPAAPRPPFAGMIMMSLLAVLAAIPPPEYEPPGPVGPPPANWSLNAVKSAL